MLHVDFETSHELTNEISIGDLARKPGWIRLSIHPTTTTEEVKYICKSVKALCENHEKWSKSYDYDRYTNEFVHRDYDGSGKAKVPLFKSNPWAMIPIADEITAAEASKSGVLKLPDSPEV